MRRMTKTLANEFCDLVCGPGMRDSLREWRSWLEEQDVEGWSRDYFWPNFMYTIRDCGHDMVDFVMFKVACAFEREYRREREVMRSVEHVFRCLAERVGYPDHMVRGACGALEVIRESNEGE